MRSPIACSIAAMPRVNRPAVERLTDVSRNPIGTSLLASLSEPMPLDAPSLRRADNGAEFAQHAAHQIDRRSLCLSSSRIRCDANVPCCCGFMGGRGSRRSDGLRAIRFISAIRIVAPSTARVARGANAACGPGQAAAPGSPRYRTLPLPRGADHDYPGRRNTRRDRACAAQCDDQHRRKPVQKRLLPDPQRQWSRPSGPFSCQVN